MEYNKLTPAEERVIVHKGTEALLPESMIIISKPAPMFAGAVMHHCTIQKINLIPNAVGQVLMMRFPVRLPIYRTQMAEG